MLNSSDYTPLVSIVIPAYNASNYLGEAIKSALSQTYSNIEIIVVNDGSADDGATEKVALSFGEKIKYFYKKNGGSSSAINYGINHMQGEWFSWLSHDDLYHPRKIEMQIDYLRSLSANARESCVLFTASELINASGNIIMSPSPTKVNKMAFKVNNLTSNEELISEPTTYNFHGCGCLVHKSVFEKLGAFDENLRLLNDCDMWFRIYSAGFTVRYIPEILVQGRVHAKQLSTSIGYSYHNPEQDMFWRRSLQWLKSNCANNYSVFYQFGKNAFIKTRYTDGNLAFVYAEEIHPTKRMHLKLCKTVLIIYSKIRDSGKKLYLKLLKR